MGGSEVSAADARLSADCPTRVPPGGRRRRDSSAPACAPLHAPQLLAAAKRSCLPVTLPFEASAGLQARAKSELWAVASTRPATVRVCGFAKVDRPS